MTQPRILKLAASASALVAALAMGTAGAVTASAADTVPTADLKINNAAGRTFAAVKVGDYTQVQAPPPPPAARTMAPYRWPRLPIRHR